MSNYEYLPIEQAKPGDVIECQKGLFILNSIVSKGWLVHHEDTKKRSNPKFCKLVKTKPGSEAKPGDIIIITDEMNYSNPPKSGNPEIGSTWTVTSVKSDGTIYYGLPLINKPGEYGVQPKDCRVICKAKSSYGHSLGSGVYVKESMSDRLTELHDSIEEFIKSGAAQQSITLDSMSHKLNYKGPIMAKSNKLDIEIKVNGETVKTGGKSTKAKTDLELIKKQGVFAVYFNQKGAQVHADTFKTEDKATQLLATPDYIGCTVVIFNQGKAVRQKLQLEKA